MAEFLIAASIASLAFADDIGPPWDIPNPIIPAEKNFDTFFVLQMKCFPNITSDDDMWIRLMKIPMQYMKCNPILKV